MNFFMFFSNSTTLCVLVIRWCFAVKSVVGTYGSREGEISANRVGFAGLTFECRGEHLPRRINVHRGGRR